ncbi:MAG: hypothetical protein KZQ93_12770 [Candidatus Thiodiazotropha sp. (ex Monitilora ramsayi)]|nr:hypothetical protein [Candidatus Thiodiazotropha sp. (ex Monitilora ramsayi)]
MNDMVEAMEGIKIGLSLFGQAIGLVNQTKDLLPESQDKEAIEKSLAEADKAAKMAEAQLAQALGYKLCKCTFPPQIMLSNGYKEDNYAQQEEFICPLCKKSSIPPPAPDLPPMSVV